MGGSPLSPADPPRLGGYRLTGVLGDGGQGTVYLARSPSGGEVAVKAMHPRYVRDEDARRRFLREIELAERVSEFGTARVLGHGVDNGRPYVVSEYVPGPSLAAKVAADGPLTGGAWARLAVATITTLAAIHRDGVVHRDYKPGNLILGPEGPVLIDFGIARAIDQTGTTETVGTPAYMAPEQLNGEPPGIAGDVFSWASTMVFAATGHPAFRGATALAVLHAIASGRPDLSGVPTHRRELLAACLDKRPGRRPNAEDLRRVLVGERVWGVSDLPPAPAARSRVSPLLAAIVAVVLISAAVVGARLWSGSSPTAPTPAPESPIGEVIGRLFNGHFGAATAVAVTHFGGRPMAVTGHRDTAVRRWDLSTGEQIEDPLTGHTGPVRDVAVGASRGTPLAATVGTDDTLRIWDLKAGRQVGAPLRTHSTDVYGVALTELDDRPVAVTASFSDGSVHLWDLRARRQLGRPLAELPDNPRTLAVGRVRDVPIAVTGGRDGISAWDLTSRERVWGPRAAGREPASMTTGVLNDRPVVLVGGVERVSVRDLATGRPAGRGLTGHTGEVNAVAVTELGGSAVAITADSDRAVRLWDLEKRKPRGRPLTGNGGPIRAMAVTTVDDRPVVVTGGFDNTARVWDPASGKPAADRFEKHHGRVTAVAATKVRNAPAVVTGGYDNNLAVWRPGSGRQVGETVSGYNLDSTIEAVAVTEVDGRPIGVFTAHDHINRRHIVQIWNLRTGRKRKGPMEGHTATIRAIAVTELDDSPFAVTGSDDRTLRLWNLKTGRQVGAPWRGHTQGVRAVAVTELDGEPIVISAGYDRTVRMWDPSTGRQLGEPLTTHRGAVMALAVTELDGRPIALTGGSRKDPTVRAWDLTTRREVGGPLRGHTDAVQAIVTAELDGRPIAATAGLDGKAYTWRLRSP